MVQIFADEWVRRPEDLFRSQDYKDILREMENNGEIEILDKDGITPKPAETRRKHKGKPSLSDALYVRLAGLEPASGK
jgi:hypothetical protein